MRGADVEQLIGRQLDADHVAVLANVDARHVGDRETSQQAVVRANLGLAARLHARGEGRRSVAQQVVVGLHRGEPVGRVAKLRLRGGDLLLQQLRLLARLGQHRFELWIVAIERRRTLLILLRLLSERRLLLWRERHRRRLARWSKRVLAAAATRDAERRQRERNRADRSTIECM